MIQMYTSWKWVHCSYQGATSDAAPWQPEQSRVWALRAASRRLRHFPAYDTFPPGVRGRARVPRLHNAYRRPGFDFRSHSNWIQWCTNSTVIRAQSQARVVRERRGRRRDGGGVGRERAASGALRGAGDGCATLESKSERRARGAAHFSHFRCDSFERQGRFPWLPRILRTRRYASQLCWHVCWGFPRVWITRV